MDLDTMIDNITRRTGISDHISEKTQAIQEAIDELSRVAPLRAVMSKEISLAHTESLTEANITDNVLQLANFPIEVGSLVIKVTLSGMSETILPTDSYHIDYLTGKLTITDTDYTVADTAYNISYRLDSIRVEIDEPDNIIRVDRIELPKRSTRAQRIDFESFGNYIVMDKGQFNFGQSVIDNELLYIHCLEKHTYPGDESASYPRFLDDVIVKGASGILLKIRARELTEEANTTNSTSITNIQNISDDEAMSELVLPDYQAPYASPPFQSLDFAMTGLQSDFDRRSLDDIDEVNLGSVILNAAVQTLDNLDYDSITTRMASIKAATEDLMSSRLDIEDEAPYIEAFSYTFTINSTVAWNGDGDTQKPGAWWFAPNTPSWIVQVIDDSNRQEDREIQLRIGNNWADKRIKLSEISALEPLSALGRVPENSSPDLRSTAEIRTNLTIHIGQDRYRLGRRFYGDRQRSQLFLLLDDTREIDGTTVTIELYDTLPQPNTFKDLFTPLEQILPKIVADDTLEYTEDFLKDFNDAYDHLEGYFSGVLNAYSNGLVGKLDLAQASLDAVRGESDAPLEAGLKKILEARQDTHIQNALALSNSDLALQRAGARLTRSDNLATTTERQAEDYLIDGREKIDQFSFGGSSQGSVLDYNTYARSKINIAEAFSIISEQYIARVQAQVQETLSGIRAGEADISAGRLLVDQARAYAEEALAYTQGQAQYIESMRLNFEGIQILMQREQLHWQQTEIRNSQRTINLQYASTILERIRIFLEYRQIAYGQAQEEVRLEIEELDRAISIIDRQLASVDRRIAIANVYVQHDTNAVQNRRNTIGWNSDVVGEKNAVVAAMNARVRIAEAEITDRTRAVDQDLTAAEIQVRVYEANLRERELELSGNIRALDTIPNQISLIDRIDAEANALLNEFRSIINNPQLTASR